MSFRDKASIMREMIANQRVQHRLRAAIKKAEQAGDDPSFFRKHLASAILEYEKFKDEIARINRESK